ncbi:right-handed parallel beta-helix repeat-containing protein [Psychromonas sp. SR45-3]|uniref:right-handed parallel beta-helix repeat-containing protein n=1 Tax=Psychromonas sp. SR45-3 TaxID=2760930 RepID=UPI0015FD59BC|nr:right-handed parallel beta-helix repeat-containing protein [Psychromonas sp. SR45-3]MBB1272542.1 right-handed parallel beta-helix repeat-containing protein [Psychromonas sp. SR45-3]
MIRMPLGIRQPLFYWENQDPISKQAPLRTEANDSLEEAGQYWVHYEHPEASDTNGDGSERVYGSPDFPRKSVPRSGDRGITVDGEPFPPNTVITLVGYAPYSGNGQVQLFCEGTAQQPVWLRGQNSYQLANYKFNFLLKGCYINIEHCDLSIDASSRKMGIGLGSHNGSSVHHVMIRKCYGDGGASSGRGSALGVVGLSSTIRNQYILFYDNYLHGYGDWVSGAENDYHAMSCTHNADYFWCIYNTAFNCGGDGVQVGRASLTEENNPSRCNFMFIGGNHFYDNGENAVDIKGCNHVVVSSNDCHGEDPEITSDVGKIVVLHNNPKDVWIINNKIYDGGYGVSGSAQTDVYVIGNTVEDIAPSSDQALNTSTGYNEGFAINFTGSKGLHIYNNTLHNNYRHISVTSGKDGHVANCILSKRSEKAELDIYSAEGDLLEVSHCIFDDFHVRHEGGIQDTLIDTNFASCLQGDALLDLSDTANRFRLLDGSPCIDQGKDISETLALFESIYGVSIATDQWDFLRTQGGGIDIGASEHGPSYGAILPKSVASFYVDVVNENLTWENNSQNVSIANVYEGDTLIAQLNEGEEFYNISGLSTEKKSYSLEIGNDTGVINKVNLTTDILSAVVSSDKLTFDIDTLNSYRVPRLGISRLNNIDFSDPVYSGAPFTIDYHKAEISLNGVTEAHGYNYVLADNGNNINGSFTGNGVVELFAICSNYSDSPIDGQVKINDSIIKLPVARGFTHGIIRAELDGNLDYTIKTSRNESKSAVGIAGLREVII